MLISKWTEAQRALMECYKIEDLFENTKAELGYKGTLETDADRKQFRMALDARFSAIEGPDGQNLNLDQLFADYTERDLLGLPTGEANLNSFTTSQGNSNSRARAIGSDMRTLRVFDQDDELKRRGWKEYHLPKECDLDNLDDGGFRSFSEQLKAIAQVRLGKFDKRLEAYETKQTGQVEATSDLGGFFLSERFQSEVLMSANDEAPYLGLRRHFIMDGRSMVIPRLANEDTSSDEVAGLAMARVAEGGTFAEDEIQIAQTRLTLGKAGRIVNVSNELMQDSVIGIDQVLRQTFGKATSLMQGKDFFSGTGGGQPLGFLNANDLHTTDKEEGQSAVTIQYENVLEMAMRLDPGGGEGAVWLAHPNTLRELALMVVIVGTGGHAIWAAESINRLPRTLLGWPVHFTEHALTLGTKGDLNLVNMASYFYAMQGDGLIIEASPHAQWTSDRVSFRAKIRDDGLPWRSGKKTDRQGHQTANFVTLETRA